MDSQELEFCDSFYASHFSIFIVYSTSVFITIILNYSGFEHPY